MFNHAYRDPSSGAAACSRPGSVLLAWIAGAPAARAAERELLVFAAASLTNVLEELGARYTRETGQPVKFSFAASSALARQLEAGAGADVFISADVEWMDYVQARGLIDLRSRRDLLGNRLVLIAPASSSIALEDRAGLPLAEALGTGPARDRRPRLRSGRPLRALRARRRSACGARSSTGSCAPTTCAPALAFVPAARPARHRVRDRREGRSGVRVVGRLPRGLASADHLSGRGHCGRRLRSGAVSSSSWKRGFPGHVPAGRFHHASLTLTATGEPMHRYLVPHLPWRRSRSRPFRRRPSVEERLEQCSRRSKPSARRSRPSRSCSRRKPPISRSCAWGWPAGRARRAARSPPGRDRRAQAGGSRDKARRPGRAADRNGRGPSDDHE